MPSAGVSKSGPFVPSEEALGLATRWQLHFEHSPTGGQAGDLLGRGTGSSMEFHDRRRYEAGDDVRHIDWRVLARTDELFVRVHREEVVPRLDLFLDLSRSMGTAPAKAQRLADLAGFFALAGRAGGQDVRIVALENRAQRLPTDRLLGEGLQVQGERPLPDLLPEALAQARPQSTRILISDFLVPMDPADLVRKLAQGGGRIILLQVLSQDDADPEQGGALRLVDCESGAVRDVVVDRSAVKRYLDRLERLEAGLSEETRRLGGTFETMRADQPLDGGLTRLVHSGLLR